MNPNTRQGLAAALSGLGAGMQGNAAQFMLAQQKDMQLRDEKRRKAMLEDGIRMLAFLKANKPELALQVADNRLQMLEKLGGDPRHTMNIRNQIMNDPSAAMMDLEATVSAAQQTGDLNKYGGMSAEWGAFQDSVKGLTPEQQEDALLIRLGLKPRAVGNAQMTITNEGIAPAVAQTEQTLAEGRETGKLTAQAKLSPDLQAAITEAEEKAKQLAEIATEDRSNERTFEVYNTGMANLAMSLDNTLTGPFAGMLPALTSKQQTADGAVAAMAPVLKQMFRAAGEGIFTDRDQALLMDMIPLRTDRPEAVQAKIEMIDSIVRAKLGISKFVPRPAGYEKLSAEDKRLLWETKGIR